MFRNLSRGLSDSDQEVTVIGDNNQIQIARDAARQRLLAHAPKTYRP
jgi:rRNA processing protein Krr1/Pno1